MKIDGSDGFVDHRSLDMDIKVKAVEELSRDHLDDDTESQATQEEWYLWRELPVELSDEGDEEQQAKDTGSKSSYGVEEEFSVEKMKGDFCQQSNGCLKGNGQSVDVEEDDLSVRLKRRRGCSLSSVASSSSERVQVGRQRKKSRVSFERGLLVFESNEQVDLRCLLWKEALEAESGEVVS